MQAARSNSRPSVGTMAQTISHRRRNRSVQRGEMNAVIQEVAQKNGFTSEEYGIYWKFLQLVSTFDEGSFLPTLSKPLH